MIAIPYTVNCSSQVYTMSCGTYLIMLIHAGINLKSLRELCISAIMSALLEQRSLHHDDLQARLPGYVPTVVRHSIIHTFKAHTHAL